MTDKKFLKIHCFQHADFEDLGCIKDWCIQNGHRINYTRFFEDENLPAPEDYDWLIIMGGPMSIFDDENYSWLKAEKAAIKEAIRQNKTVLGICLGSQLIADVLGARVYKNPEKEIGWFNISLTEEGKKEPVFSGMNEKMKVFHWHGDTFELPEGAKNLAFSEACNNQAFLYNRNVLGLQFHFEVTEESLREMLRNGKEELTAGKFIQSESEILTQKESIKSNNTMMFHILNSLASDEGV
ncbi:type 1 glutamine amidotransferase [Salegentibacter sp. F188]|uniref:Type 1 glutamine amidotransferase n=1 Tax=Autumnicola patrickiae TaxID=3075591 RepID=A0ABU3E4R4_9FLAO|nr:type 1 glutamine amidotransferase [Salegentibacter sp. F188]MDT0690980.1 type 1 glutamine amidotransferase [Salegentibacter sp. F188]